MSRCSARTGLSALWLNRTGEMSRPGRGGGEGEGYTALPSRPEPRASCIREAIPDFFQAAASATSAYRTGRCLMLF